MDYDTISLCIEGELGIGTISIMPGLINQRKEKIPRRELWNSDDEKFRTGAGE